MDEEKMNKNEIEVITEAKNKELEEKDGHFTLQWHLLERCNLRCKHCYQNEDYIKEEFTLEEKKSTIDDLVSFCKKINKIPRISFTGGEPFIIKEELFALLDYCKNKYPIIETSILTNGTMINEDDIEILKNSNLRYIQVSLDGGTMKTHDFIRGEGNFHKALKTVKLLNQAGILTAVMTVFHRGNFREIPELVNLCDEIGVDFLGITELVPIGRGKGIEDLSLTPLETKELFHLIAKKQLELIKNDRKLKIDMKRPLWVLIKDDYPEMEDKMGGGCAAGFSGLALLPNGNVMACRRINQVISNLRDENFFEIWYGNDESWKLREREDLGECSKCKHNPICSGCKAISLSLYGNYLKKDIHCWY